MTKNKVAKKTIKIAYRYNKNQGCLEKKVLEFNIGMTKIKVVKLKNWR